MATNANIGKNSVLLFGDYGVEVIKLSQLYDPDMDEYEQCKGGTAPSSTQTYFTATCKDRTIEFSEISYAEIMADPTMVGPDERFLDKPNVWTYNEDKANVEHGKYVPAAKTLVVVDDPTPEYGTYTLLVVDSVDDESTLPVDPETGLYIGIPTYKSHLSPINFTGGVDNLLRAIDYNNDQMMLFVEDITLGSGKQIQKLTPDRKLMLYGQTDAHGTLCYTISRLVDGVNTTICTNSYASAHADAEELVNYVAAGAVRTSIKTEGEYDLYVGCLAVYFDETGAKQEVRITEEDKATLLPELTKCFVRGEFITIHRDSENVLNNVHLPESCYLRASEAPLTTGELVDFTVYEKVGDTKRTVLTVKLTVRAGTPFKNFDRTSGQIVEFNARLGNAQNVSDVWDVAKGTTASGLDIRPFIRLDDGTELDISAYKGIAYFEYGLEQVNGTVVGTEFDILFKFFPSATNEFKPVNSTMLDTRYIVETAEVPSPTKQYLIRTYNSTTMSYEYALAGDNGYLTAFENGVTYVYAVNKFGWNAAVNRPSRACMSCRKRVRIVTGTSNTLRKLCVIPVWNHATEKYTLKFLPYDESYATPKLIGSEPSEDGYVLVANMPENWVFDGTTAYNMTLSYFKDASGGATASKTVAMKLGNFSLNTVMEKWLLHEGSTELLDPTIVNGHNVYGRHAPQSDVFRPYVVCEIKTDANGNDYGTYYIPLTWKEEWNELYPLRNGYGFNNTEVFLEMFYNRIINPEIDTWYTSFADEEAAAMPTHFRYRSVTDSDVHSKWISVENVNRAAPIAHDYLPKPSQSQMGTVVVEFAYRTGDTYKVLLGVPVEVLYVS